MIISSRFSRPMSSLIQKAFFSELSDQSRDQFYAELRKNIETSGIEHTLHRNNLRHDEKNLSALRFRFHQLGVSLMNIAPVTAIGVFGSIPEKITVPTIILWTALGSGLAEGYYQEWIQSPEFRNLQSKEREETLRLSGAHTEAVFRYGEKENGF